MSARISPPGRFDATQRALLARAPIRGDGEPVTLFATLAHHPQLLRRVNALGGYFPLCSALTARDRELAILRTAAHVRSGYVEAHHRRQGAQVGLGTAEIEAALNPRGTFDWPAADRKLLAFVDELVEQHTVSDATWDALDGSLEPLERLDVLALVGFYVMVGGVANALRFAPDP